MALLRQLLLLPLALAAGLTTMLPVDTEVGHTYDRPAESDIPLAAAGIFLPAALIAFVAAVRLFGHSTPVPDALPKALLRASRHRHWRAKYAALDARVARDLRGRRTQKVCAYFALVLGIAVLLPASYGPAKLAIAITHIALFVVAVALPDQSSRLAARS
jgi:hypothetical protein